MHEAELLYAATPFLDLDAFKAIDPEAYHQFMWWLGQVMSMETEAPALAAAAA